MTKGSEHPDAGPLTEDEVRRALEMSGYPLEVELLSELAAASVPTLLGQRHELEPGQFKEIDLSATIIMRPVGERGEGRGIHVVHKVLLQVKKPAGHSQLVGVLGRRFSKGLARAGRLVLSGSVSDADAHEDEAATLLGTLSAAAEPFDDSPLCAHWAMVKRRRQDGRAYEPWASGDDGFYEDFSTLVRVRDFQVVRSRRQRRGQAKPRVKLRPITIALVVDQPHIFVYDPLRKELREVPQMTLVQDFDTAFGPVRAFVDCIARNELTAYVGKCKQLARTLCALAREHADSVYAVADSLRNSALLDDVGVSRGEEE